MTRALLLALLLAAACSGAPEGASLASSVSIAQRPSGAVATAYGGSCDATSRPTLSLDPRWSADDAAQIRLAAAAWDYTIGSDLGDVPTADSPCERSGELLVPGCIARAPGLCDGSDSDTSGIVVWIPQLEIELARVIAHELGHWLGIHAHSDSPDDIMHGSTPLPNRISDADIIMWEDSCL